MESWFRVETAKAWLKGAFPSTSLRFGLAFGNRRAATTSWLEIAAQCNGAFLPPRGTASISARPCTSKRTMLGVLTCLNSTLVAACNQTNKMDRPSQNWIDPTGCPGTAALEQQSSQTATAKATQNQPNNS